MSVISELAESGNAVTIKVNGRFDFKTHEAFRKAYEQVPGPNCQYVVDLSRTEHMDSSALGMLLMLREYAGGSDARIAIENCPESIRSILTIASFDKLFRLN